MLAITTVLADGRAEAATAAADACQTAIERGGYLIARQILKGVKRCTASGETAPIDTCLAGATVDAALDRVRARWIGAVSAACASTDPAADLGYLPTCAVAPSSCTFPSAVFAAAGPDNDLLDCLTCRIRESLSTAGVRLFANQPVSNGCHEAIGSGGTRLIGRMLRRLKHCQSTGATVSLAACLADPGTAAHVDADIAKWRAASVDMCTGSDPIASPPGYPTLCGDATPEFPGICPASAVPCRFSASMQLNNPTNEEDDLLDCLTCHAMETMLEFGRTLYGANQCCIGSDCGTVRTRRACIRAGGTPARYTMATLDAGPIGAPHGLAMGTDGTLYIADTGYSRVKTVSPGGQVNVLANVPGIPFGMSVSPAGDVYVNLRCGNEVLHVTQTGTVTVFAGTGTAGHSGDEGPAAAAQLVGPNRSAADAAGNVYITESGYLSLICGAPQLTASERVRVVDPSGTIHTVIGGNAYSGGGLGGPALSAGLGLPYSVGFAADGTLLVGEAGLNRVLHLDALGNLQHVAGNPMSIIGAYFGDGGIATQARFYQVCGVAQGPDGMLFVADMMTNRVRMIDRLGSIISAAGTGLAYSPLNDGGPASQADAGCPEDVVVAPDGRVYFSSLTANKIRVLTLEPY